MAPSAPKRTSLGADGSNTGAWSFTTGAWSFTSSALARPSDAPAEQSHSQRQLRSRFGRERLGASHALGLFILAGTGGGAARLSRGSPTDKRTLQALANTRRTGAPGAVSQLRSASLDHLVGAYQQGGGNLELEDSCGLEVHNQFEPGRQFDRQLRRFRSHCAVRASPASASWPPRLLQPTATAIAALRPCLNVRCVTVWR